MPLPVNEKMQMNRSGTRVWSALAIVTGLSMSGFSQVSATEEGQIGILTCDVSAGVDHLLATGGSFLCDFQGSDGPPEAYSGIVGKYDSDVAEIGYDRLVWEVLGRQPTQHGSLAGDYQRQNSGSLIGGLAKTFMLRPVKIESEAGKNFAPLVVRMTLVASN